MKRPKITAGFINKEIREGSGVEDWKFQIYIDGCELHPCLAIMHYTLDDNGVLTLYAEPNYKATSENAGSRQHGGIGSTSKMTTRYTTFSGTTGSVLPGASTTVDITSMPSSNLDIKMVTVTPSVLSAGELCKVEVFKRDTYLAADRCYVAENFYGTFVDPAYDNGTGPVSLNEGDVADYEDLDGSNELHVKFTNNGPTAKTFTYSFKVQPVSGGAAWYITPEQFGAVGDGTTDDLTALNLANAYLNANPGTTLIYGPKVYAISSPLTQITSSGVRVQGSRPPIEGSSAGVGSWIKAIGAFSGNAQIIAPTADVNHYHLSGITWDSVGFNSNGKMTRGLWVKSVWNSWFNPVLFGNFSTCGFETGCVTTLGNAKDTQANVIDCEGYHTGSSDGFIANGISGVANTSFNVFRRMEIVTTDGTPYKSILSDNNTFIHERYFRLGTGSYSADWGAGTVSGEGTLAETHISFSSNKAPIARTGTTPAGDITILALDKANNTPDPVLESGATVYWRNTSTATYDGVVHAYTPTVTADGTPLTSVATAGFYQLDTKMVRGIASAVITTDGVGAGGLRFTLPSGYPVKTSGFAVVSAQETSTGIGLTGNMLTTGTFLRVLTTAGAYPGGNGKTVLVSFWYFTD